MNVIQTRLLCSVLLLMPALISADETQTEAIDTSRWLCSLCIYPLGWFGTLEFGPGYG
jgi:hypothetical protein